MSVRKPKSGQVSVSAQQAEITVLAGVNGAGKSSIGGAHLRASGSEYFNPDEVAAMLRTRNPGLTPQEANAIAWQKGKELLEQAIAQGSHFTFETTLGGKTITEILIDAAKKGVLIRIWYAGLESVELHLQRVARRVKKGGHDIPESDIRKRWSSSYSTLIRLIPHVATLSVFDNSLERDPATGTAPEPGMVLAINERRLTFPNSTQVGKTPQWAKPIVYAAYKHFGPGL